MLAALARLEGPFHRFRTPGGWLWAAMAFGVALRAWLVLGTGGTLDVDVWAGHAWEIHQKGIVGYYHGGQYIFNHPPLMGEIFSRLYRVAAVTGIPFAALLRAPFALLDAGTAVLLFRLLGDAKERYALPALYWVLPLPAILSAYHGNTDAGLAFFLVAAVLMVSRGRALAGGVVLGMGLWIKFPAILAVPALAMALPTWNERARFGLATGVVGILTYVPALWQDAEIVIRSVFFYPGLQIQSTSGIRVWGTQVFYPDVKSLSPDLQESVRALIRNVYRWNTAIVVTPIALVAWLRRGQCSAVALAGNVSASFAIFHGLTNFWAFQYLAWALPLWLLAGWRFALPAYALSTAYVYVLYAWLCGGASLAGLSLAGSWDWMGHPFWPATILALRNAAVVFFFATACWVIGRELLHVGRGASSTDSG